VDLDQAAGIVVRGHSHCGVMRMLLSSDKYGIPAPFASRIRPAQKPIRIVAAHCGGLGVERLLTATWVNVLVQLENLRATASIAARLDGGDLHLHGWLSTGGDHTAYNPRRAECVDLAR
jgi:carbonic anhydrase